MTSPTPNRSELADALPLLVEFVSIFGPPILYAVTRAIRAEHPELIPVLERALETQPPPIGATPPTAEDGRIEVMRRRVERMLRRFGRQ